jgi:hypothetical protein
MLLQGVARDMAKRGVRAVEAFGDAQFGEPRFGDNADSLSGCLAPAEFFLAVGFKTVRPHLRFPRLRLELRTALSWKADVEYALERLLGSMNPEAVLRRATQSLLSGGRSSTGRGWARSDDWTSLG